MLSYRHGFHAGNPADVFKHSVVLALLRAMQEKPGGITCIDTHTGAAVYDLSSDFACKNREFERGILPLWHAAEVAPALDDYLHQVRALNHGDTLRYYPGSSQLLRQLLRPQDRLILCELHPTEQAQLSKHFHRDRRVTLHHGDGYAALANYLPPGNGRGLILIDPPYELKTELQDLRNALEQAMQRFGHGVYALWYPLIEGKHSTPDGLPEALHLRGEKWLDLRIEFAQQQRLGRMFGCGMAIINCPFRARQTLQTIAQLFNNT
jgi:23S rRNA (adenine2030-N6)-methyltransferase